MILDSGFERRTAETVRRMVDDIHECRDAEINVLWNGGVPTVRIIFGDPRLVGRPMLGVQLITESRKHPLAPGRIIEGDELRRHVLDSVARYMKFNGIGITRKVELHAGL